MISQLMQVSLSNLLPPTLLSVAAGRYNFMVLVAQRGRLYVLPQGQLLTMSFGLAKINFVNGYLALENSSKFCTKLWSLCSSKIIEMYLKEINLIPQESK